MRSFCSAKASHIFSTKNIGIFQILTFEIFELTMSLVLNNRAFNKLILIHVSSNPQYEQAGFNTQLCVKELPFLRVVKLFLCHNILDHHGNVDNKFQFIIDKFKPEMF